MLRLKKFLFLHFWKIRTFLHRTHHTQNVFFQKSKLLKTHNIHKIITIFLKKKFVCNNFTAISRLIIGPVLGFLPRNFFFWVRFFGPPAHPHIHTHPHVHPRAYKPRLLLFQSNLCWACLPMLGFTP